MAVNQKTGSKRAATHAADTEGHVNTRVKATAAKGKKAAPRAADTEGHVASRIKAPNKR